MNPWHDVNIGCSSPEIVTAIIEVPKGSKNKYELDKETGLLRLDRVLFSSVHYPANYGFLPRTYCSDNDPLDILVLGQEPVTPLCIVEAIPIGLMRMSDQGEDDDKIIAVSAHDPEYNQYTDINELAAHKLKEVQRFFQDYKILENKKVIVENFLGKKVAKEVILTAISAYSEKFRKGKSDV